MSAPREPAFLRAAAALGGAGTVPGVAEGDGFLAGSRVLAFGSGSLAPVARTFSRVADPIADGIRACPPGALLGGAVALPVFRLLGAPPAGILAVAGVLAVALVVRWAAALHGAAGARVASRLVLAGILLRLVLAGVLHAQGGLPDERGYYHPLAAETAAAWSHGETSRLLEYPVVRGREAYYALLSAAYLLVGADPWTGRLLGLTVGMGTALLAGEAARRLGGPRAALAGVGLVALHPEHALWSATLSRDSLTTLLALTALVAATGPAGRPVPVRLALAAAPVALLWRNSFLVAGALTAALLLVALGAAVTMARRRGPAGAMACAAALLAGLLAAAWVGRAWGPWFSLEMVSAVRNRGLDAAALSERALGFTTFLPGLVFPDLPSLLAYLPVGAAWVLAAPLPVEATGGARLIYALFALGGLVAAVVGIVGLLRATARGAAGGAAYVAFAALFLGLLAALEASSGVVVRHRLPLTAVLMIGAAPAVAALPGAGRSP